ncbi:alpha-N-acetylglucosaminidase [Bacteroides sedimenti]|uniref:Alpha-N-acetylglucosaminidase n=1 Tax=Bacteroides sedimenti TaxID=2136147 RepID=A0ABN6ZDG6_9BACE
MMKKSIYLFVCLFFLSLMAGAKGKDVASMQALVKRLIPSYSEKIQFKELKPVNGKDCFQLESGQNKIVISGNNANSMAMGLNYYLKYYCLTTVSWYADIPVEMPDTLPAVKNKIRVEAKVDKRFFLNYCTYGYTMTWWQWKDWERFIDWMALNGINMPLAITGQEAVWYKVWRKLGLSDQEIRSYFTGPTYLPWHRMANIDGWNGPLPMEWLDNQVELQKKILSRERELSMKPVLPAFAGHVPGVLKRIYPDANIQYLSKWAGFEDAYRCSFLNPEDPLFAKIQKQFLQEQTRLFGTDHIYGLDPFNEVDPPSWEPDYLRKVSSDMYRTLTAADSKAIWLQMTWMFYFDRAKWTAPRIEALLKGVPQDKMYLLDYHCENTELWKTTERFHGQPYIWCYLGNFGGNTTLTGNVKESGKRLDNALINGGANFKGVGSTLEGLDVMQFPYEYIFEKAWNLKNENAAWLESLADRHVGYASQPVREAWDILFNQIYVQVPKTLGVLPNFRPVMKDSYKRSDNGYQNATLLKVWAKLLQAPDCKRDAMRVDVITVGRQLLGNHFLNVKKEFDQMYAEKDLPALKARAAEMKEILNDLESLNAFHPYCTLDKWIADARALGDGPQLKDYYEKNARNLITTWGGRLNDYASRTWAGLIKDYYSKRWNMYMDAVILAAESDKEFDQKKLDKEIDAFENSWVNSTNPVKAEPKGELLTYARFLLKKYENRIK